METVEATVDEQGNIHLLEPLRKGRQRRALITILDEPPRPIRETKLPSAPDTALLSEPALFVDWNRPEEEEAWDHLQSEQ
ncbi:MAG: hypothetical protein OHK0029_15080 [Armatimonadaceae bacterium]